MMQHKNPSAPHNVVSLRGFGSPHQRPFHIAVLSRSRAAGIAQVVDGIITQLNAIAPGEFSVTWIDGNHDEKAIGDLASMIIKQYTMPYDALVTVGALSTQVAARLARFFNIRMPIIFTSIFDPQKIGLFYVGVRGNTSVTGIIATDTHYGRTAHLIQSFKKTAQNILIPYDPSIPGTQQQITETHRLLMEQGMHVHFMPIQKTELVTTQIASRIHNVDTLITLRSEIVVAHMPHIVSMCNDYGVTIVTSDLASVKQGAAIGISPKEEIQGIEAANYLIKIFKESARPEELPVKEASSTPFIGINTATLDLQGLSISEEELDTIPHKIIYTEES